MASFNLLYESDDSFTYIFNYVFKLTYILLKWLTLTTNLAF
jgi:hypothetical protein